MRRIAVIVLAAGRSSRFGGPVSHKLLATVDGTPVVRVAVEAALRAAVGTVVVVTGFAASDVEAALAGLPIHSVRAPDFADGMAASLRAGIASVRRDADAVIIALGDQPLVRPEAYRRVAEAWRETGATVIVPRYADDPRPMHPILFASAAYDELAALRGDVGARSVVAADAARVARVALAWPPPRDVDTEADLAAVNTDAHEARAPDTGLPVHDASRP